MPDLAGTKNAIKKVLGLLGEAVGTTDTQTVTNKTVNGADNTISNVPDSALSSNITTNDGTQTLTNKTLTTPTIITIHTPSVTQIAGQSVGGIAELDVVPNQPVNTNAVGGVLRLRAHNESGSDQFRIFYTGDAGWICGTNYTGAATVKEVIFQQDNATMITFGTDFSISLTNRPLKNITLADASDIVLNTNTGTKIGTATNQKLGFFNKAPVVQPAAVANSTATAASASAQLNLLLARMRDLGLIAT